MKLVMPEMIKANKILIETQLGMKKGDEMLIPTMPRFLPVAESAQAYADSIGVKAYIVVTPPSLQRDVSKTLQNMVNEVDGIYMLAWGTFNTKEALDHDTRILGILLDDETLVRTLVHVDIFKLKEESLKIRELFTEADTLRITSEKGTDYTEDISGIPGSSGYMWAGDLYDECYQFSPIGYPGYAKQPPKGRGNGTLVYDIYLSPFGVLTETVSVTVEKDEIVNVEGGWEAKRFWDQIKDWPEKYLCEMEIGINPNARVIDGKGPEWERYRGAVHFGMGSWMPYPAFGENGKILNPEWKPAIHHCDGMIIAPTVYLDDKVLVKDGIIQKPYAVF